MRSQRFFDFEIQNIFSEISNLKQGLNLGLVNVESCVDHVRSCIDDKLSVWELTCGDDERFKLCLSECSAFLSKLTDKQ
jgi:hypothetical protein